MLGPAWMSCAVPSRWMSVHEVAEASQRFTCPGATAMVPAFTVAVSVIPVPEAIDPPGGTVFPFKVIVNVVAVEAGAAQTGGAPKLVARAKSTETNNRQGFLTLKTSSSFAS